MNEPVWQSTAQEPHPEGDPPWDVSDVIVVGGGYTGLACALFAAEAGLRVQVCEAAGIGAGASGRNVGLVNAGLWLPPDRLEAALGPERGRRFVTRFADAPREVFALIERHQIRCEATREATVHAAHAPGAVAGLTARCAAWQRLGAPVEMVSRAGMFTLSGSRAFHGGLMDHRAGTVNPAGYARGLARVARAAGARIATHTPVTALARDGGGWRVETARATLRAAQVVLATNAYSAALWPGLERCFWQVHYMQAATAPLGALGAHVLPGRQGLWDTGTIMRSLRKDRAGRLMIGTMGALTGASRGWAQRQVRRWYPELGDVTIEAVWDGRIAMTADHLPRLLRLDTGLYCPMGYNGRGITTGTVFGKALAEVLSGGDPEALPLPLSAPEPVRFKRWRERAVRAVSDARQRL